MKHSKGKKMEIKFLGATQTVTGSKHLVKGTEHNILVDCGLYQGPDSDKRNKEIEVTLGDEKIDAIVLTHAHLDHCGYIPKLYKSGFRGPIFCTAATFDIAILNSSTVLDFKRSFCNSELA